MSLQQPMNYQTSACYPCKDIFSEFYTVLQDWIRLTSNPKAHLYTDIYYNDGFFSTVKAIEFSFCIFDAFHYIYIIKFVEYLFSISRYYYFPHRLLHMRTAQVKLDEVTFPDHTTNKCQLGCNPRRFDYKARSSTFLGMWIPCNHIQQNLKHFVCSFKNKF